MIAIDTNIIIRFLVKDDEIQFKKSLALFKNNPIFIADTVILEVEWVLRYAYNFNKMAIYEALTKLFGLENIHLSNPTLISQSIQWYKQGLDFADAMHLAQSQQCHHFFTFDKKFINKSKGLCDCLVLKP